MSTPAKDAMIESLQKEERDEYDQWLDWLDLQQEWLARLVEQGYLPTTKEQHHAEVQH